MLIAVLATLVATIPGVAIGDEMTKRAAESTIKGAILFNILLFVQTHPRENGIVRLGVLNDAATAQVLRGMVGGAIGHATLSIVEDPQPDDSARCDAIYVGGDDRLALYRVAAKTVGDHVLLIGEGPFALENGAMIGLLLVGDHYVIDVNLAALRREHIEVSSKLLRLARRVLE